MVTNELIDKTATNFEIESEQKVEEATSSNSIIDSRAVLNEPIQESMATWPGNMNELRDSSKLKNKTGNGLKSKL